MQFLAPRYFRTKKCARRKARAAIAKDGDYLSLGVVLTGIWRYWRLDAIPTGRGIKRITSAMASGSIVGATLGGLAVAYAPVGVLKVILGSVLIVAAAKTIRHQ